MKQPSESKGELRGECARSVCHSFPATWFNKSTRKYYCLACAVAINRTNYKDALELYGTELCVPASVLENG